MISRVQKYIRAGILAGVVPTLVLLVIGLFLRLASPHGPTGHQPLHRLAEGIIRLEPDSFLSLGMLLLYMTPLAGAASALAAFAAEKDSRGALLTLAVLCVILCSILVAKR